MARKTTSTLHLQVGQETIYLLLTGSLLAILLMLAYIVANTPRWVERANEPPPIIRLEEANGYSFQSGSALITDSFKLRLETDVVERVRNYGRDYGADIIEIVGHTDETSMRQAHAGTSNLDDVLLGWLRDETETEPVAFDNVGLGMARAVAVAKALEDAGLGDEYEIIPLSAGQLVLPGDRVSRETDTNADAARRRIEIRVRRRTEFE
ncbi:MAG: hypothetical protein V3V03_08535 [Hyphomonadaceae bacterium]